MPIQPILRYHPDEGFIHECSCRQPGSKFGPIPDIEFSTLFAPMQDHLEAEHPTVDSGVSLITARDLPAIAAYFKHLASDARRTNNRAFWLAIGSLAVNAISTGFAVFVALGGG